MTPPSTADIERAKNDHPLHALARDHNALRVITIHLGSRADKTSVERGAVYVQEQNTWSFL